MNNQIRDLAVEAGASERSLCYGHGDYRTELVMTDEVIERFAELMLKASFDVVISDGRFHDAKGIIKAGKYTAMEHFGVEL
jgi:hypothetical protein